MIWALVGLSVEVRILSCLTAGAREREPTGKGP